jgi:hypothetical protein
MEYAYWKQYDNNNYSFEEAFNIVKNDRNIQMRVIKPDSYKEIRIDYDSLANKNMEDIELPLWAIRDNYWHLYEPDYEMEYKVDELRDYLDSVYDVDSRFYNISKMDISDIFSQLDDNVLDDKLRMEIIFWLRDNNKIKQKY